MFGIGWRPDVLLLVVYLGLSLLIVSSVPIAVESNAASGVAYAPGAVACHVGIFRCRANAFWSRRTDFKTPSMPTSAGPIC